ncbi:phage holin family protein [Gemella sp. Musashino-2025]
MTELQQFISPVIMAICLLIGNSIKTSFPKIPNNYIPAILAVVGAVLICVLKGYSGHNIVTGIVSGLSATGLHQIHKGIREDNKEKK